MKITVTLIVLATIATSCHASLLGGLLNTVNSVLGGCQPNAALVELVLNVTAANSTLSQIESCPSSNTNAVSQGQKTLQHALNHCPDQVNAMAAAGRSQCGKNQVAAVVGALTQLLDILQKVNTTLNTLAPSYALATVVELNVAFNNCNGILIGIQGATSISDQSMNGVTSFVGNLSSIFLHCVSAYVDYHCDNDFDGPAQDICQGLPSSSFSTLWSNQAGTTMTSTGVATRNVSSYVLSTASSLQSAIVVKASSDAVVNALSSAKLTVDAYNGMLRFWKDIDSNFTIFKQNIIEACSSQGISLTNTYGQCRTNMTSYRSSCDISISGILSDLRAYGVTLLGCFRSSWPSIQQSLASVCSDYELCVTQSSACYSTIVADLQAEVQAFYSNCQECIVPSQSQAAIQACMSNAYAGAQANIQQVIQQPNCNDNLNAGLTLTTSNFYVRLYTGLNQYNACKNATLTAIQLVV